MLKREHDRIKKEKKVLDDIKKSQENLINPSSSMMYKFLLGCGILLMIMVLIAL
jgi:hypothetical protein